MDNSSLTTDILNTTKPDGIIGKIEIGNEDSPLPPHMFAHTVEREIQQLERDIRHQKESSVNAKTAITFEQLRQIHIWGNILGPQKEQFYDRICRAADIQRASLKNRLKQNKEKFESTSLRSPGFDSPSIDSQTYMTSTTLQNLMTMDIFKPLEELKPLDESIKSLLPSSTFPGSSKLEEDFRIPAGRILDLLQLGFSFQEVTKISEMFGQYKEMVKSPSSSLQQLLSKFSNYISTNTTESSKLISSAFNLLEMGYSRDEVARTIKQEGGSQSQKDRADLDDEPPMKIARPERHLFETDGLFDVSNTESSNKSQADSVSSDETSDIRNTKSWGSPMMSESSK
ncbi:unnamed protein product [Auanema sp. JU1783]|nr:unnamed protein product [Auanema sp. JU1783]